MYVQRLICCLAAATLVGSHAALTAQAPLLQTPSRSFHTGHQVLSDAYRPEHSAVADMDGDGDLDIVTAHTGNIVSPKVSVMLNLGSGGYGAPVSYAAPGQTMEVALADFDLDGDVDAAFAQSDNGSAGNRVLVYENTGNGSLLPYVSYTVGTGPTALIAVDVDGDGDPDLVSANNFWMQEDVSVLVNDGTGAFPVRTDFALTGLTPRKVAAGDLTGDGAPELVVSLDEGDPAFAVLTNDGSGVFGAPAYHSTGLAAFRQADVAVADVDLDGDGDVLYGTTNNGGAGYTQAIALFRNDGTGLLGAFEEVPVGPYFGVINDIAVADVTGDGWPDVLGTERLSDEGFVLVPGDGTGGFGTPTSFRTGEYARSITAADTDGDGDLDAVVTNRASLTVTVHENDGGGFARPPLVPLGQYLDETGMADLDQDGDLDVVTGDFNSFWVLENQGDGTLLLEEQPSTGSKSFLKLRDLDGDGYPDALFGGLAWALNDGTGTFGPVSSVPGGSAFSDVDTLDMDGDGDLDAVVPARQLTQAGFFAFENDGTGSFGPPVYFSTTAIVATLGRIGTGDFTGDGNEDVVLAAWDAVWLWAGDGAGSFAAPVEHSLGTGGAASMTVADLDGDGLLDVAGSDWGRGTEGETLTLLYGNGDGTFAPPLTYLGMFSQWRGGVAGLTAADADGDGDLDLIGGCYGADDVAVFLNNGDRTFASEERYGVDGDVQWVAAGDLDGDGRADVVTNLASSAPSGGGITVLMSAPPQVFVNLGFALASAWGTPALSASGSTVAGSPIAFHLENAAPQALSILVISENRVDIPLFGGTLVPVPDNLTGLQTSAEGSFTFQTLWPTGMPAGTSFYEQVWTVDPFGPAGFSASNALQTVQSNP